MRFTFILLLISLPVFAEINLETHDFTFEYGLSYHTVLGEQKSNDSKGKFVTNQMPFWNASYSYRLGAKGGIRFFGGMAFLRFEEPPEGDLLNQDQILNNFGVEIFRKTSPLTRTGIFLRQNDHPVYFAKTSTDFEMEKKSFGEAGLDYSIGQRRRIGLLWGLGGKAFLIFPTRGGDVTTEGGYGAEAHARLGWVGPWGTLFQVKGFFSHTSAPNAAIEFVHENLGYCGMISLSF